MREQVQVTYAAGNVHISRLDAVFLAVFLFLIGPCVSLIIKRIGKLDFLAVDESLL